MSSGKLPAMMFYTGDWLKDPSVARCTPATRGVWIDLLCAMHESGRLGVLCGTREQLSRIARCSTAELAHALTEIQTLRVADVTERNAEVTVVNRRMSRDAARRQHAATRQVRSRQRRSSRQGHDDITRPSSYSSSDSSSPPAPACDPATAERQRQVVMVMKAVSDHGVVDAKGSCQAAIDAGATLEEIKAILNYYDREGGNKPEALHHRIKSQLPGQPPEQGWLPAWRPDPKASLARRREADDAERDRQAAAASEAAAAAKEATYGPAVDSLSNERIAEMVNGNDVMKHLLKKSGRSSPIVREWLIHQLEKSQ